MAFAKSASDSFVGNRGSAAFLLLLALSRFGVASLPGSLIGLFLSLAETIFDPSFLFESSFDS